MKSSTPTILVFDSGLGGLTVFGEIVRARPDARYVYVADDAVFPYGRLPEDVLVERVNAVIDALVGDCAPDICVIACHTASTLVLPHLRARHAIPFVGTVPAVKPAAAVSLSHRISVLATPGTVARDYTHDLVRTYAGDCVVTLVGSTRLASLAEEVMAGHPVPDEAIAAEIAPCFVEDEGGRTDTVVLACTHYPLLLDRLQRLAPWPVTWIDPAPAIARRVVQLIGTADEARPSPLLASAVFTSGARITPPLETALCLRGVGHIERGRLPAATGGPVERRWLAAAGG